MCCCTLSPSYHRMPQLLHKVAHGREDDAFLAAIRHAVGLGSDWKIILVCCLIAQIRQCPMQIIRRSDNLLYEYSEHCRIKFC